MFNIIWGVPFSRSLVSLVLHFAIILFQTVTSINDIEKEFSAIS